MNIVFFQHPKFLPSQSMPRFASMLVEGMTKRGHNVKVLSPTPNFYRIPIKGKFKKWLGYIDQYLVFPFTVKKIEKSCPSDTIFIFTDQALGPWVPLVSRRRHVIHCHDFLALQSSEGSIEENPTGTTGKIYQNFIKSGFTKGKNFISVSNKTKADLETYLTTKPRVSEVVYNSLNPRFLTVPLSPIPTFLSNLFDLYGTKDYILHVGGNQWYKNRMGVIEIYDAWRTKSGRIIPLLMAGPSPNKSLSNRHLESHFRQDIHFLTGLNDDQVHHLYKNASTMLFPSLEEGFGWPIVEAMASGCPVLTTGNAPMSEVGGHAAVYLDRMKTSRKSEWAMVSADVLEKILNLTASERLGIIEKGLENVKRFESQTLLDRIENIYKSIH